MADNRESLISIRSAGFKDENVKFELGFRMDFGKSECAERMNNIKSLGIDPSNNVVVMVHEFSTEDGAKAMVTKINEFKAVMGAQVGKMADLCETIKAEGKKVIVSFRIPPEAAGPLSILDMVAASMGDFASKHQFLEFKIAGSNSLQEILMNQDSSAPAALLEAMCLKLTLSLQKDLPIKIADFVGSMAPESERARLNMVGHMVSAFHHFKLEVELKDPTETVKQAYKNEIMMVLMGVSQMLYGLGDQFGFIEAAKNGGARTTLTLCLSPILSFEFGLYAPTAIETIKKMASPM